MSKAGDTRAATREKGSLRILQEPLLHFLAIGAALFLIYGLQNEPVAQPADGIIEVTPEHLERLSQQFASVWGRPPVEEELDGLVADFVREEVYYREALALGLDQDDAIIRRRLQQKMQFLGEAGATAVAPEDGVLREYYDANRDKFTTQASVSFEQVFLGQEGLPGALDRLREGADPAEIGVPTLLPPAMQRLPKSAVDGTFGDGFFAAIEDLPVGDWQGPVSSGFGQHAVRVVERKAETIPPFEAVRDDVEEEWRRVMTAELQDARYEAMRAQYTVILPGESK